ncbi:response regulator transcription factor [Sulfurovum sp.]|uniref:response regulator transcription factor n=1 Tax=Sulfurovum sp. TaxID=1969726 RepID=UPI0025DC4BA9|nr:response regulator transcription factor [Sulfurovum sp.]
MKILIVEDDKNILSLLQSAFVEENHIVDVAKDGEDGEYLATMNHYDVIILDWMLPKMSGLDVLHSLRKQDINTPVLMLTAKGEIADKVTGLNSGADDYLAKPFSLEELQARVEALYRRIVSNGKNTITIKNISIDINDKTVKKNDEKVPLTAKEYELLMFLVKQKNSYVSKFMIEEQLWTNEDFKQSNVIEVTIYHMRKKLGKDFIKNFKGLGYKIEA